MILSVLEFLDSKRYELLQQEMSKGLMVPLKFLKFVFFGPPGAGKTTFMLRLIGEIEKIDPNYVQPSTITADQKELVIKVYSDEETQGNKTIVINPSSSESENVKSQWCSVTKEDGCNLDEEAMMIYCFINDLSHETHLIQTAKVSQPPAKVSQPPAKVSHPPAKVSQPPAKVSQPPPKTPEEESSTVTLQSQVLSSSDNLQADVSEVNQLNEAVVSSGRC